MIAMFGRCKIDKGNASLGSGPDRSSTLFSMAIYSSHRAIMGKML